MTTARAGGGLTIVIAPAKIRAKADRSNELSTALLLRCSQTLAKTIRHAGGNWECLRTIASETQQSIRANLHVGWPAISEVLLSATLGVHSAGRSAIKFRRGT